MNRNTKHIQQSYEMARSWNYQSRKRNTQTGGERKLSYHIIYYN